MTQQNEVLDLLRDGWTCGTVLLRCYIPRYAARILELRRQGFRVERRRCQTHPHASAQFEWRVTS